MIGGDKTGGVVRELSRAASAAAEARHPLRPEESALIHTARPIYVWLALEAKIPLVSKYRLFRFRRTNASDITLRGKYSRR